MPAAVEDAELLSLSGALDAVIGLSRRIHPAGGYSMTARSTAARLFGDGPARISDLARAEGVTQPAMTGLVNRLEADGLVTRAPDPADARASLVDLTEHGRAFIVERRAERSRLLAELIARLEPDDRAVLAAAGPALQRLANLS